MQIDKQVLQALPDDIRNSIEESLSLRRQNREVREAPDRVAEAQRSTDMCSADESEQPGCSHWTSDDPPASIPAVSTALPLYFQVICFK